MTCFPSQDQREASFTRDTLIYTTTRPMQISHQGEGAQRRPLEAAQRLRDRALQEQLQALEHRLTRQQQQHLQVDSLLFP